MSERKFHPSDANARLIAVAQDLLDIAKEYAANCPGCFGRGVREHSFNRGVMVDCQKCSHIRSTIIKATQS
jgi:hypothetical protein